MFVSWKRNVLFDRSARTLFTEVWRHLTCSNEPNFINNEHVGREITKRANLYGIVLFPRMLFLAMYTFVIVAMRLCGQRNTSPK